jgi:hypothetical protein
MTTPLPKSSTSSPLPSAPYAPGSKGGRNNTVSLILYEMGMDDKAVRRIMGITQEAIRSTRYRIMQNGKK